MGHFVKRCVPCVAGAAGAVAASASGAFAAVDLTGVTFDTTSPETLAATVLAGLAVMWGIRKLIKLINRS
jgi:hypothetical protein